WSTIILCSRPLLIKTGLFSVDNLSGKQKLPDNKASGSGGTLAIFVCFIPDDESQVIVSCICCWTIIVQQEQHETTENTCNFERYLLRYHSQKA
ncbi:MAG: hypothetical protein JSW47_16475, partial [Phycisphaerales bacterium]